MSETGFLMCDYIGKEADPEDDAFMPAATYAADVAAAITEVSMEE